MTGMNGNLALKDQLFLPLEPRPLVRQLAGGTLVVGRYEIVSLIDSGSSGLVYLCRDHLCSGYPLAMKVISPDITRDPDAFRRAHYEISLITRVRHPNVVRALNTIVAADFLAFTMEYVDGANLHDKLLRSSPLSVKESLNLLTEICAGLEALHNVGIVHHDLKPANILLTSRQKVKLSDLGVSREVTRPLTAHGTRISGTVPYISPEYLRSGMFDRRSDIYSLGVIAYEMLTGETPFRGKNTVETLQMRFHYEPAPVHLKRLDCPESLSRVISKAMQRDPKKRFQTSTEMSRALANLLPRSESPRSIFLRKIGNL